LSVGGLTPEIELVRAVLDAVQSPSFAVNVMVRPHARDFIYTDADIEMILADTRRFASFDVDGVVFGAHTPSSMLDVSLIRRVAAAAAPIPITLHRALDTCANPNEALAALVGIVPRVLTSGPAATAWEGRDGLRNWIATFGKDMQFVVSGAIRLDQVRTLVDHTGAHEVHIGGAAQTDGRVDPAKVRALLEAIRS